MSSSAADTSAPYICSMSDIRAPEKRSACDRCRTQKLRCLRVDGHPTFSCIRCVRSQVECMTSSSKRPGRPTKNLADTSRQLADPTPGTYREVPASADAMDVLPTDADDWFNSGSLDAHFEISSLRCPSVDSGELYSPMIGEGSTFTMSSLSCPTNGSSTGTTLLDGRTESTTSDHYANLQPEQGHIEELQLLDNRPSIPSYDCGLRLSILYRDLSKQLFILRSMPWDMTEVMRLTCIHNSHGDFAKAFQANFESNPLAGITKWSAEFAELLGTFQSAMASDCSNAMSAEIFSSTRLGVTDLLGIISCHMLIVSIYDSIFYHFIDQYLHNPYSVNLVMQSAPKLFLGGIEVPPWPNMMGHLLFCLTESQLRPIELLLGLPDEFCVALKRNPSSKDRQDGLLSGQCSQSIFTALMQVETEKAAEGIRGKGVIESLKEKTRRVQILN